MDLSSFVPSLRADGSNSFEVLSGLCTVITIDEARTIPVRAMVDVVRACFDFCRSDGDTVVLGARALGQLFTHYSNHLARGREDCQGLFRRVVAFLAKKKRAALHFSKCSEPQLVEELLLCLSAAFSVAGITVDSTLVSVVQDFFDCVDSKLHPQLFAILEALVRRQSVGDEEARKVVEMATAYVCSLCAPTSPISGEWETLFCAACQIVLLGSERRRVENTKLLALFGALLEYCARDDSNAHRHLAMAVLAELAVFFPCAATCHDKQLLEHLAVVWQKQQIVHKPIVDDPFVNSGSPAASSVTSTWKASSFELSLLAVTSYLFHSPLQFLPLHVWFWDRGDAFVEYPVEVCAELTAKYLHQQEVGHVSGRYEVNFERMVQQNRGNGTDRRVLHSPVSFWDSHCFHTDHKCRDRAADSLVAFLQPLYDMYSSTSHRGGASVALEAASVAAGDVDPVPQVSDIPVIAVVDALFAEGGKHINSGMRLANELVRKGGVWPHALSASSAREHLHRISEKGGKRKRGEVSSVAAKGLLSILDREFKQSLDSAGSLASLSTSKSIVDALCQAFLRPRSGEENLQIMSQLGAKNNLRDILSKCDEGTLRQLHRSVVSAVMAVSAKRPQSVWDDMSENVQHIFVATLAIPVTVCTSIQQRCPSGHVLKTHHSTTWRCNNCGRHSEAYGALSCRLCNYDLCHRCAPAANLTFTVSALASVSDVLHCLSPDGMVRPNARSKPFADLYIGDTKLIASQSIMSEVCRCRAALTEEQRTNIESLRPFPTGTLTVHPIQLHLVPVATSQCLCGCIHTDGRRIALPPVPIAELESVASVLSLSGAACGAALQALIQPILHNRKVRMALFGAACLPRFCQELLFRFGAQLPFPFRVEVFSCLTAKCYRHTATQMASNIEIPQFFQFGDVPLNFDPVQLQYVVHRGPSVVEDALELFSHLPGLYGRLGLKYENEEGIGDGPTREAYSELWRELGKISTMWRSGVIGGLFPSSVALHEHFQMLGRAIARAFIDGYWTFVPLHPFMWKMVERKVSSGADSAEEWSHSAVLQAIDPELHAQLHSMEKCSDDELRDMGLYLNSGAVTSTKTLAQYISERENESIGFVQKNIDSMFDGMCDYISPLHLSMFCDTEMGRMFCGLGSADEPLFDRAQLERCVVGAHGYNTQSQQVVWLVDVLSSFSRQMKAYFVEFLTGDVVLPPGGLEALGRPITIVKKDTDESGESTLPSCNTCFLYLKLPPYTSRERLAERISVAVKEGRRNFALS